MVDYALRAHDCDTARLEANALQYVVNFREAARPWQRLVEAVCTFYSADGGAVAAWERGVKSLAQLRDEGVGGDPLLGAAAAGFAATIIDEMYGSLPAQVDTLSSADVLQRVRVYGLILDLARDDPRARSGIQALSPRLAELSEELQRRYNRLIAPDSATTTGVALAAAEALFTEMVALEQALKVSNQAGTPTAQALANKRKALEGHLQRLGDVSQTLSDLRKRWNEAIAKTWEIQGVREALETIQRSAGLLTTGGRRELEEWEGKAERLGRALEQLIPAVERVNELWDAQDFQGVSAGIDELNKRLKRSCVEVGEDGIQVPDDRLDVYDPQAGRRWHGTVEIRKVAGDKNQNLNEWRRWVVKYEAIQEAVNRANKEASASLDRQPRELSTARERLCFIADQYGALLKLIAEAPKHALCGEAEENARQAHDPAWAQDIQRELQAVNSRTAEIDVTLNTLVKPLSDIERFKSSARNLGSPSTQKLLASLVKKVWVVDASHPAITSWIDWLRKRNPRLLDEYLKP